MLAIAYGILYLICVAS